MCAFKNYKQLQLEEKEISQDRRLLFKNFKNEKELRKR